MSNPQIDMETGLQIKEALQLQLDAQRRLHEELEIQWNLRFRIEEQRKQLEKMFDLQQKTSNNLLKTQNLDIPCNEDGPSNSLCDTQVSASEGSGNTQLSIQDKSAQEANCSMLILTHKSSWGSKSQQSSSHRTLQATASCHTKGYEI